MGKNWVPKKLDAQKMDSSVVAQVFEFDQWPIWIYYSILWE